MRSSLLPVCAALFVCGCSTGVETRVSSNGVDNLASGSFIVSTINEPASDLRIARSQVVGKLAEKGYLQAEQASMFLEVTFDVRDASLSLGDSKGPESIAGTKKRKPLQNCADREYRLGVTLTRITDGTEMFRGRAAEYHCHMSAEEAIPALVDIVLADWGSPRGSYILKRAARD